MDNVDLTTENAIFLTEIINEVINNGPIANMVSMNVEGACECVCVDQSLHAWVHSNAGRCVNVREV